MRLTQKKKKKRKHSRWQKSTLLYFFWKTLPFKRSFTLKLVSEFQFFGFLLTLESITIPKFEKAPKEYLITNYFDLIIKVLEIFLHQNGFHRVFRANMIPFQYVFWSISVANPRLLSTYYVTLEPSEI